MTRRRANKSPVERKSDVEDDDFYLDDCSGRSPHEPVHRNAANARERARMRVLSKAFCRLKTTLPWVPADTKLSKLDTLRLAASYIGHLRSLLREPGAAPPVTRPLNLAWPFAFQHGGSLSCSISPRWSISPQNETTLDRNEESSLPKSQLDYSCSGYAESAGAKRAYHDGAAEEMTSQYCSFGYNKEYYDVKNMYSSNSLV